MLLKKSHKKIVSEEKKDRAVYDDSVSDYSFLIALKMIDLALRSQVSFCHQIDIFVDCADILAVDRHVIIGENLINLKLYVG